MSQVTSDLSTSVSTLAAGPATTSAARPHQAAASTTSPVTSASPSSSSSPTTATSSASNGSSSSVTSIGTTASTTTSNRFPTTSGGSVFTVVVTSTSTPSSPNSDSSGSTSSVSFLDRRAVFWNNTGAVVGVFTVVGLIGLALLILIITTAIRRRRAVKFDKEIAAAAADAAAAPRFPFDDYSDPSGGGGGYGYSDNSHGTYAQPPMRPVESYGMTEMSQYEPYAVGAASGGATAFQRSRSRKESEVGTPGIAGVGAGNLAREPSRRAPYHAFAGPNPQDLNDPAGNAAGLAGTGAAALAHDGTGTLVNRRPSDYTQNTHRSGRSHGYASSSEGGHPSPLQPGYRQESNIPQRSNSRRENRVSLQDDTDYAQEPRVLRVCKNDHSC
ncbi:hypothetical protein EDD16DRAFT_1612166 [Pisolithus croceorrhizus]|nr:hypothetical protein EDD16DRAFT_1612166 [Pisolithus croceorrhizus]